MTSRQLLERFKVEFGSRRFIGGLLVAMIDFLYELDALGKRFTSLDNLLRRYPRQQTTRGGKAANTLIVKRGAETLSLRPFYNEAEEFFQVTHFRFDYPNCAPHATQAWGDYRLWFDSLLRMSKADALRVRREAIRYVLRRLPSHEVDASTLTPIARRYTDLLEIFNIRAKGEPPGAVFQGFVYAYLRADAPHLHLEISKVGAGSKRLQRVGDIDGWDGELLVISGEVKSYIVREDDVDSLIPFISEVRRRNAMGIIGAVGFGPGAREKLAKLGVRAVDLDDLKRLVDLWDPLKQQAALAAFTYYVHHIQKNDALKQRLNTFLTRKRRRRRR